MPLNLCNENSLTVSIHIHQILSVGLQGTRHCAIDTGDYTLNKTEMQLALQITLKFYWILSPQSQQQENRTQNAMDLFRPLEKTNKEGVSKPAENVHTKNHPPLTTCHCEINAKDI